MDLEHATVFRVTRNSEYEIDDDEVEDLLKTIEEEVRKRRRGAAVRLEIEADAPAEIEQFLTQRARPRPARRLPHPGPARPDGPVPDPRPARLSRTCATRSSCRSRCRSSPRPAASGRPSAPRDILVHHPYESFGHVVDFIEAAANDDRVLAIKQTLYRTSSDSPIVRALQRAADNGKQVTAVIELKARLDEERNIVWARELEKAGVHVVFGFVGLKTHCKVAAGGAPRGRRHPPLRPPRHRQLQPADGPHLHRPGLLHLQPRLLRGRLGPVQLPDRLLRAAAVAQAGRRPEPDAGVHDREDRARGGSSSRPARKGGIIAKINGLLEPAIVQALYRASQAGVRIDLICRGICSLRPGMPGVSENIRVISIVDRFLEHSRIFYFGNGGDPQVYIGSADWMDRNLSRRVEVVFPIEQPDLKQRLIREILATSLARQRQGARAVAGRELSAGRRGGRRAAGAQSGEVSGAGRAERGAAPQRNAGRAVDLRRRRRGRHGGRASGRRDDPFTRGSALVVTAFMRSCFGRPHECGHYERGSANRG